MNTQQMQLSVPAMKAFFAIDYTIHFDDTMAYGSHHFLTAFKFQCASREAFLFGDRVFDIPGVKDALEGIHLLTSDAYSRNLQSMRLGERVAIFLTLEDWGKASARFCYRVLDAQGNPVCAGFQTLVCADAATGDPIMLPAALSDAMDSLREIEEPVAASTFRHRVLTGGRELDSLFGEAERQAAVRFLADRYPQPAVVWTDVRSGSTSAKPLPAITPPEATENPRGPQAWVFAGQGGFDAELFCHRINTFAAGDHQNRAQLQQCIAIAEEYFGPDATEVFSGVNQRCAAAIESSPALSQVAIHLQNVLGALLWRDQGNEPAILMGHSFGEIAALAVANCFDMATGVEIVCRRHRAIIDLAPSGGGLLAVFAPRYHVEATSSFLELTKVRVAGRNHDGQTIATGPLEQLVELEKRLKASGIRSAHVPSPAAFHHPDLHAAAEEWYQWMSRLAFHPPAAEVFSPIGKRFITAADDLAGVLASQLVRPFDLQGAVLDLAAWGIETFVDCGSTGSLARLLEKAGDGDIRVSSAARATVESSLPKTKHTWLDIAANQSNSIATKPGSDALKKKCEPLESLARNNGKTAKTVIVSRGCILPAGASSPEQLFDSIIDRRVGLVDQRDFDPHWSEDFYSPTLVADRSTSHLSGRVDDATIVCPPGVDGRFFDSLSRTEKLLCIALAPCKPSLRGADRIICLMGATADGFEDQDVASSLVYSGIDPADPKIDALIDTAKSAGQTPHNAVQRVVDELLGKGVRIVLIDAACASSLYSVALGMELLETDRADAVIAGGVFCPGPGNSCLFSQFRGTTATGCRPFDAGADGVVFSEGAAVVTLRRAHDARRLGLSIDAVVRGAGLSSDGRSSSANVPQSHGQILSLQRCYERYDIDPRSINAIEAHGTSTPAGDATEVETLRRFFQEHAVASIPIHSLKGSIGHAGWAAGSASLIAACEYLTRKIFPPQAFFREPSSAVKNAAGVLTVPTAAISIAAPQSRIAIDGFGFGGANAHVVLEAYDAQQSDWLSLKQSEPDESRRHSADDDEVIIVALAEITPRLNTKCGRRFDRDATTIPSGFLVLPELADDMDISQILTVSLAQQLVSTLHQFDESIRNETSVVLAMSGKTERGIEATTRITAQRLRRLLINDPPSVAAISAAYDHSRPSRAYTLQCMMPNVAAGRAALLLNLRGPNFVVDAGHDSLEAALLAGELLLGGGAGTKLALVAAMKADSGRDPNGLSDTIFDEFAAGFALTTRAVAKAHGWTALLPLSEMRTRLAAMRTTVHDAASQVAAVSKLVRSDGQDSTESILPAALYEATIEQDEAVPCPVHTPIWVKTDRQRDSVPKRTRHAAILFVPDDESLVIETHAAAAMSLTAVTLIVVGSDASEIVKRHPDLELYAIVGADEFSACETILNTFAHDLVAIVQRPSSSDLQTTLSDVVNNTLCEVLFLAAKHEVSRLRAGTLGLWQLVAQGWHGDVHPCTGGGAGLIKSIRREIPACTGATVCTGERSLRTAMACWLEEVDGDGAEQEVVFDSGQRLVRRLVPVAYTDKPHPQVALNAESVVIATGGARGVTAVMLEAILRDYGCTVVAFGRSEAEEGPEDPSDPAVEEAYYREFLIENPGASLVKMKRAFEAASARWEVARTLASLRSSGGTVEYHAVDVTDAQAVRRLIADVAARHGRIDFLIHGAGVQLSKKLEHRSLSDFRRTFAVKVRGLQVIVDACFAEFRKIVPTHVLTSAYSIFGNDGQHDYCAANETMDRLCQMACRAGAAAWSSIAWLAWDGVGMTRGSEYRALAKQRSLSGVDAEVGQRIFRAVLSGRTAAAVNVPLSSMEHVEYRLSTFPNNDRPSPADWCELPIDLQQIAGVNEHKVRGVPTLPGAWIADRFVAIAKRLMLDSGPLATATIRGLQFNRLVRSLPEQDPNIRAVAKRTGDVIDTWMISDVYHPSGQLLAKDVVCARAYVTFNEQSVRQQIGLDRFIAEREVDDPYCQVNPHVELSGFFDCLCDIQIATNDRRAAIRYVPGADGAIAIPALALDAAWRVGAMHADEDFEGLFVPVEIEEIVFYGLADAGDYSHGPWEIRSAAPSVSNDSAYWCETTVFDGLGRLNFIVKNASARRIAAPAHVVAS